MALISCPECATKVSDKAGSCPSCGFPLTQNAGFVTPPLPPAKNYSAVPTIALAKSRGTYIILGLIFGWMGLHNFYSGHNVAGALKIGIFFVALVLDASTRFYTAFSLVSIGIFTIWALVEVIRVKKDALGNLMS